MIFFLQLAAYNTEYLSTHYHYKVILQTSLSIIQAIDTFFSYMSDMIDKHGMSELFRAFNISGRSQITLTS